MTLLDSLVSLLLSALCLAAPIAAAAGELKIFAAGERAAVRAEAEYAAFALVPFLLEEQKRGGGPAELQQIEGIKPDLPLTCEGLGDDAFLRLYTCRTGQGRPRVVAVYG